MPQHSTCSIVGCERVQHARGWCSIHYGQWRRHGDPLHARTLEERLWSGAVEDSAGCWVWQRSLQSAGYGQLSVQGVLRHVHRLAYELAVGPIPDGLTLDHLCRNRACINPAHLEPVTQRENTLRGVGPSAANARKTECLHGHLFDDENTRWYRGKRNCRECSRERMRRVNAYARATGGKQRVGGVRFSEKSNLASTARA